MSIVMQDFVFSELYLQIMCDSNDDNTRNLILRGNELIKKIGKRVQDKDVPYIIQFLWKHPEVVALEMPHNQLGDCGVQTITSYLAAKDNVRHLNLVGNRIGPTGVQHIVSLGEKLPLYTLRLSGNHIGDEGGRILSELLYMKIPLKELDVSDTHQSMTGLAYLFTGLMWNRGGADTLEYVDLGRPNGQFYHTMGSSHAAEFAGQILRFNTGLKELHLQQYKFFAQDMEIMLDGLMVNHTLLCLDLNNNSIADDGVLYLCKYLETRPPLRCLMLGGNKIKDLGARTLSFTLPNTRIRLIDLTNNEITDTGILDILYTLHKPVIMRGLFLWGNKITHTSLVVMKRMFLAGTIVQEHTDIRIYEVDGQLYPAWYPSSNRYTHRFYCVSDYGHPPMRRVTRNPPKPKYEPRIHFKHHVDDKDLGLPLYASRKENKLDDDES